MQKKAAPIVEIKVSYEKMHRLLIAFRNQAVVVYSMNKHQVI